MYFEAKFHDAVEQEASLPGWRQEYRQISKGGYSGQLSAMLLPGVQIIREMINVETEQIFSAPKDRVIFYYYPKLDRTELAHGDIIFTGSGFALNWTDRIGFMDAHSDLLMLVLDCRAVLTEQQRVHSGHFVGSAGQHARFLAEWLLSLLALSRASGSELTPQVLSILADIIKDRFEILFQYSNRRELPYVLDAERTYRLVRDKLHAAPNDVHSVASLSRDLGIPASSLRGACAKLAPVPLDQMLMTLRLNGARRDLIQARDSTRKVSDIAMDWGFFHWGRFASRYRELFGETPSRTRKGRPSL
ncbi:helix-turn-helix transcriptional regulator [Mesorhizobium sp. VK24D]|uniref:Helix-turn-helix transcriptional regulator n=1 Tax=Mesorhizobium album TaxID=3072314 RepID=A0ABU4XZQ1_9HYPH|nr:helix-turn-helix transcriptional regulator [Mesorhizobium sp. VK24D]MDX8480169.1 helix-turn-helix transcriptional regulator [Mesorhizobium sp. VK24D]